MIGGREQPHLALAVPGSLEAPRRVRVDGVWTQPGFDPRSLGRARIRPWRLALPDVGWKLLPDSAPFLPSPVEGAPDKLLELLALTNREKLALEDLKRLVKLLSAGADSSWWSLVECVESVSWRERPAYEAKDGTRLEVTLRCRTPGEDSKPLLEDLVDQIEIVLNAWCTDPVLVHLEPIPGRSALRLVGVGT